MRLVSISAALIAVWLVSSGCTAVASQRQEALKQAHQQAMQIAQECREQRLAGVLSGHVESARCSNDRMRQLWASAGYPYMDLVDLFLAYRMALAQRIDEGKLPKEEAQLLAAELQTRLASEEQRRNATALQAQAQAQQARSQWLQSYGALLQGLALWNQALSPPAPQGPLTYLRSGNMITCN